MGLGLGLGLGSGLGLGLEWHDEEDPVREEELGMS